MLATNTVLIPYTAVWLAVGAVALATILVAAIRRFLVPHRRVFAFFAATISLLVCIGLMGFGGLPMMSASLAPAIAAVATAVRPWTPDALLLGALTLATVLTALAVGSGTLDLSLAGAAVTGVLSYLSALRADRGVKS